MPGGKIECLKVFADENICLEVFYDKINIQFHCLDKEKHSEQINLCFNIFWFAANYNMTGVWHYNFVWNFQDTYMSHL